MSSISLDLVPTQMPLDVKRKCYHSFETNSCCLYPGWYVEWNWSIVIVAHCFFRRLIRLHGVVENCRHLKKCLDRIAIGVVQLLRVEFDVSLCGLQFDCECRKIDCGQRSTNKSNELNETDLNEIPVWGGPADSCSHKKICLKREFILLFFFFFFFETWLFFTKLCYTVCRTMLSHTNLWHLF